MTRILATISTAAILTAGSAYAQTATPTMGEGFDMLQVGLMADFERLEIPTDAIDNLTLGQLAAIKSILEDDEESNDKFEVEAIIANN